MSTDRTTNVASGNTEEFRDSLATVDARGGRIWLYPKKPSGRYYDYRKWLSYFLLAVLFGLPWLTWNGSPLFLFNLIEGRFILFGVYFTPQDFHLFVIGMLIAIAFIVLFTVVFGRLFCGWICPQTIFMEMVFRRIEYWIEGDAGAQKRLDKKPYDFEKVWKKSLKHLIFLLLSAFIAHTFLSYIIGVDEVIKIVTEPIRQHWQGFIAMVIFTLVFYGVFARMREQVCTTICPYGRLQGVLLDENSLAVAYDFVRGEPRGKLEKARPGKRSNCTDGCDSCKQGGSSCPADLLKAKLDEVQPQRLGDCIDCKLCVQVCPTGIDIRNGTQLECVNCTACMDACDEVMVKIGRPEKLIRIDSYNRIAGVSKAIFTPRVAAYSGVLLILLVLESFLFVSRSDVEFLLLRTPGVMYQTEEHYISNLYNYQLINKTDKEVEVHFETEDFEGIIFSPVGHLPTTRAQEITEGAVFIKMPKEAVKGRKTRMTVRVMAGEEVLDETQTTFLGPIQ